MRLGSLERIRDRLWGEVRHATEPLMPRAPAVRPLAGDFLGVQARQASRSVRAGRASSRSIVMLPMVDAARCTAARLRRAPELVHTRSVHELCPVAQARRFL